MSVRMITWAFGQKTDSPSAKLVLVALADHANDEGQCWPGFKKIEVKTELSRATVIRNVGLLERKGLISVFRRVRGRYYVSNVYRLNYDRVGYSEPAQSYSSTVTPVEAKRANSTAIPVPKVVSQKDQPGSIENPGVVAPLHPNRHLETSIKPFIETSKNAYLENGKKKNQNSDIIEYVEAKLLLTDLGRDGFGLVELEMEWPDQMQRDLNRGMPMRREKFDLIDRFYRLPAHHPIFTVVQRRASIESLIRTFRWEPRRIRFALKKIGFDEFFRPGKDRCPAPA